MNKKKLFLFTIIAVIGNLLIMILEEKFLVFANNTTTETVYNNALLSSKITIWICTMVVVAILCYAAKQYFKTNVTFLIAVFYITCFLINLNIADHPTWIKLAIAPLTIIPFAFVPFTISTYKTILLYKNRNRTNHKVDTYYELNFD